MLWENSMNKESKCRFVLVERGEFTGIPSYFPHFPQTVPKIFLWNQHY